MFGGSFRAHFGDKYVIGKEVLGSGAFGKVMKGERKSTKEAVAIKIIKPTVMTKSDKKKMKTEINILKQLDHRNVVKFYDSFEEKDATYIVMEYLEGGDLFSKMVGKEADLMTEQRACDIIFDVATALKYCQGMGVIHRDVKGENILITSEAEGSVVKLTDFNLSKKIDVDAVDFKTLETRCGTLDYIAPEVFSGSPYGYKCDIWSLGVVTFLLLSKGYLPFFTREGEEKMKLLNHIKSGVFNFVPLENWVDISEEAKDFVRKILVVDSERRLNYEQVLAHDWFKIKKEEEVENMMNQVVDHAVQKRKSEAFQRIAGTRNESDHEIDGSNVKNSQNSGVDGVLAKFDSEI